MIWIELVTALATLQLFIFSYLVGNARRIQKFPAPATVGNEVVERYIRAHMNTLEMFAIFLPFLWLAARYWDTRVVAAMGLVYLVGRVIYFRGYTNPAKTRYMGFLISVVPVAALLLMTFVGIALALLA